MNYKEFKDVLKEGQLEESRLVNFYLKEAGKCQKYAKGLQSHNAPKSAVEKQLRKKEEYIWLAFFTAVDEKEQGWKYVEDGEAVLPTILQQIEDIKETAYLRKKVANGN
jgi:hypothetical protein